MDKNLELINEKINKLDNMKSITKRIKLSNKIKKLIEQEENNIQILKKSFEEISEPEFSSDEELDCDDLLKKIKDEKKKFDEENDINIKINIYKNLKKNIKIYQNYMSNLKLNIKNAN